MVEPNETESVIEIQDHKGNKQEIKTFKFEEVYGPSATNDKITKKSFLIIDSVLQGCDGTIVAYGEV